MATQPAPAASPSVFTLNISFNAASGEQDGNGFFKAGSLGFTASAPHMAARVPAPGDKELQLLSPDPGKRLYLAVYETSGLIDQNNLTVPKIWIETTSGACPLLGPLPTRASPWTLVFSGSIVAGWAASAMFARVGTDGFIIQPRPDPAWAFNVVMQVTVLGEVKVFKAAANTVFTSPVLEGIEVSESARTE